MFTQVCTCWPLSLLYRSALRDILGWEAAERGMEWTAGGAQSALVVGGGGGGGEGGWTWPGCWPCPAGRWLTCSRRGWWRGQSPASCCSADSCSCQSGTPTQSWSSALIRLSTEKRKQCKGTVQRDFGPPFISLFESVWATCQYFRIWLWFCWIIQVWVLKKLTRQGTEELCIVEFFIDSIGYDTPGRLKNLNIFANS